MAESSIAVLRGLHRSSWRRERKRTHENKDVSTCVVFDVMGRTSHNGIVCLTGVSSGGREIAVDVGMLNRRMVLRNDVVFGSVNANRRHYELAVRALSAAEPAWLERIITRRVPLHRWRQALEKTIDDVKVVLELAS